MPTPSPNQPPDAPSSSYPTFPTCPEESQVTSHRHESIDPPTEIFLDGPPLAIPLQEQRQLENRLTESAVGRESSMFSSLRAATVSPRPRSTGTESTSPERHELDGPQSTSSQETDTDSSSPQTTCASLLDFATQTTKAPYDIERESVEEEDECECASSSMGPDCSNIRSIPLAPSSYLRPGSKFHGTQQSERQVYDVQVEIKHVDMRESFLCGYLRIQGLTEDHPTLTTYFEGEIIGSKYTFYTQHEDWGANTKVDLSHWAKFSAFLPFQKLARKGPMPIPDASQREHVFMRWKEHFLVPDHRVRTITGASFEGFYYICFNQLQGEVSGIYFHSKSEK
ncbi:vesicle-mediated transporter Vid24 [Moelleriella libera RCEF 2490]|uniref:Vesicle-mediated transporter Vid24 n=1 Tax=Moelleriella libera RCEF 2490 TaxID=1081109 RepID=A0A162IMC4_9HYPO|nr:vesicle-mediated transporter Vid24 [Moelleriella libera RCEF 2490]